MNTERTREERKESLGRLSCINAMRDHTEYDLWEHHGKVTGWTTKDTWFITKCPDENVHMPDETKHVPRRVELLGYQSDIRDFVADFFIDNPTAQWMLLHTVRGHGGSGPLTVLAWGE